MTPELIVSIVSLIVAIASIILALSVFRFQKQSEIENKKILDSFISANLVAVSGDRSVGKTLLRYLRLTHNKSQSLSEEGARLILSRARKEKNIGPMDWESVKRDWRIWFGKEWTDS
jgi:hypothetical protein